MKALGLLVAAAAIGGGVYLYQQDKKQKSATTAPTPGIPVPVYGPDGAIIGYVTPTGIYPNQAPGGPLYRPPRTQTAGLIETGGCVACGGGMSPRYTATGEVYDSCTSCEDDYRRMRHLTSSVALAGAFR